MMTEPHDHNKGVARELCVHYLAIYVSGYFQPQSFIRGNSV